MRVLRTEEGLVSSLLDFSGGIIGNVSDAGSGTRSQHRAATIRHLKTANNVIFRPARCCSVRGGSRALASNTLANEPTSLARFIHSTERLARLFVHVKTGAGTGAIYQLEDGTAPAWTRSTLTGFTLSDGWCSFVQLNDTLIGAQAGGAAVPFQYTMDNVGGYQYNWYPTTLPAPAHAPTFTSVGAPGAGYTGVDSGYHYYRVRWFYRNGSSAAGPTLTVNQNYTTGSPAVAAPAKVTIVPLVSPDAPSTRDDFVSCTIERSKAYAAGIADASLIVWYYVADFTGNPGDSFEDQRADADLFHVADDTIFGSWPHVEGLAAHRNRVWGWSGNRLYVGEPVGGRGSVSESTGILNQDPTNVLLIGEDDGEDITACRRQGDRLIVAKPTRTFAVEGDDPTTFRVIEIAKGAGAIGPRSLLVSGMTGLEYNEGGLHLLSGSSVRPFGRSEVGNYFEPMSLTQHPEVVCLDYRDDMMLVAHPSELSSYNDQLLGYDISQRNWFHLTNWNVRDALVQAGSSAFGGATLIFADPKPRTPVIAETLPNQASYHVWKDSRSGTTQAYVARVNADGAMPWTANGIVLGANVYSSDSYLYVAAVPDSTTGVLCAWTEARTSASYANAVYVSHLDSAGNKDSAFGSTGKNIAGTSGYEIPDGMKATTDGAGGIICVWNARPSGGVKYVYVQRVTAAGAIAWNSGNPLRLNTTETSGPWVGTFNICPDGEGGAFVTWMNHDAGRVKVQHVLADGSVAWTAGGIDLGGGMTASLSDNVVTTDGAGGCIVAWPTNTAAFIQRVTSSGTMAWNGGTRLLVNTGGNIGAYQIALVPDGQHGAIIAWGQVASTTYYLMAQRYDESGNALWTSGGVTAMPARATYQYADAMLCSDGYGGAYIANVPTVASGGQLVPYIQRVDPIGNLMWPTQASPAPVVVSNAAASGSASNYFYYAVGGLCSDGNHGCIFTFAQSRASWDWNIYAQHYDVTGAAKWIENGAVVCSASGTQNYPRSCFYGTPQGYYPPAAADGYQVWAGFTDDPLDFVACDGTGGEAIPVLVQTPWIDDGSPDDYKLFSRLQPLVEGDPVEIAATIRVHPGLLITPVSFAAGVTSSYVWAAEDSTPAASNELVWADDAGTLGTTWAVEESSSPLSGVDLGCSGRKYQLELSASITGSFRLLGYVLDYTRLPGRGYST